jgi:hypothetical protein
VPVGATQADTPDAREHLPRLRLGLRLLVQPQLADAMEAQRPHPGWP